MTERLLFDGPQLALTLERLAWQVLEHHHGKEDWCLIGLQPRGVPVAERIRQQLAHIAPDLAVPYGELDATFHRDDFRHGRGPLLPNRTHIDFLLENRTVILVDDVLYTGRTVRAALDALLAFGRPRAVELLVLVDRRWRREVPIQATFVGIEVDTPIRERIQVTWSDNPDDQAVRILSLPKPENSA